MKEEFYFQWHFIDRCNLRCRHCYQEGYQYNELPLKDLLTIATKITDALKQWNMLGRISLTGGEPFLSHNLFNLIDFFEKSEVIKHYNILTNGTCITDEHIDLLKKYKKLNQIQISFDGPIAEIHDSIRGQGAFEKALSTIEKMKKNDIDIAVMFTLMKQNYDYAIKMIDFAEKNGISAITIERVTPCGHSNKTDILTKEEICDIYKNITIKANNVNNNLVIRRLRPLWVNTSYLDTTGNKKIGGFCPIGFTSLAILWDGTVLPCRRLNIPLGNILVDGLYKIWYDNDVLWRIRDKTNLKGKCHNCHKVDRCGGCRAIAYEMTGDYMGEDVQCWI